MPVRWSQRPEAAATESSPLQRAGQRREHRAQLGVGLRGLADDHPLILNGLEQLFTAEPEYEVVARCSDGRQALDAARRYKPHLLILDLRMPELTALDVLRALKDDALETRSIVLTASVNEAYCQNRVPPSA